MIRLICLIVAGLLALSIQSKPLDTPDFYYNTVTVNGQLVNYDSFALYSQGVLAFVEGDPALTKQKPVLFRVTLRRAGTPIQQWPANVAEGAYSVPLNVIWPVARFGDELVVEPVGTAAQGAARGGARRIIKLNTINLLSFNNNNC